MFSCKFSYYLKPTKWLINSVQMYRVMVMGGTSKLGQDVCMLLRNEPSITCLTVHDSSPYVKDVITELQHIPAQSNLIGLTEQDELRQALHKTDIILTTDGVPETTQVERQAYVSANIALISMMSHLISKLQPMPFVGIASEPINILVPMAAEIMQHQGKFDPAKLFGLSGVDSLRAQVMYAGLHMLNPFECSVPIICGHSSKTAVPLLSQATPHRLMTTTATRKFTKEFRELSLAITEGSSPTGLATAYNALLFTRAVIRTLETRAQPAVNVFIENNSFGSDFFAGRVNITPDGACNMQRYANISEYECNLLQKSIQHLKSELFEGKKLLSNIDYQHHHHHRHYRL